MEQSKGMDRNRERALLMWSRPPGESLSTALPTTHGHNRSDQPLSPAQLAIGNIIMYCSQLSSLCLSPIAEMCKQNVTNVSSVCKPLQLPFLVSHRQQWQSRCGRLESQLETSLTRCLRERDHPTNEAEQIVDNSVVQRPVIVLKSGMPFRTGEQVSKT